MNYMKYIFVAAALLTVVAFTGCAAVPASGTENAPAISAGTDKVVVQLDEGQDKNNVSVTANGTIKAAPDVAYTTVGVVTQKKKMQDAQSANRELMNAVVTALKEAGLTDDDIRTTNYSVYPVYDYSGDTSRIASFEVNNTIELTINDIDNIGEILDKAAAAGANTSYSISFDLLEKDPVYRQALTAAMESARAKADTLATAGGFKIKGVMNVSEGYTNTTVYREYPAPAEEAMDSKTYVSAGDLDVSATVSVVYEIE